MSSLHETVTARSFASGCYVLWINWLSYPNPKDSERLDALKGYHQDLCRMAGFPPVTIIADATIGADEGAFDAKDWTLEISQTILDNDDVKCEDFVEFCKSAYHETRHAEQIYRVAQALALGRLEFPGNQLVQTALQIHTHLRLRGATAQHAANNSNTYLQFRLTSVPNHCEMCGGGEPTWNRWDWTVDEWLDYSYRSGRAGLMEEGQNAPAGQGVLNQRLYVGARDEVDARSVEPLLESELTRKIPRYAYLKDQARTDPLFGS
jgi:hypothetical protein